MTPDTRRATTEALVGASITAAPVIAAPVPTTTVTATVTAPAAPSLRV